MSETLKTKGYLTEQEVMAGPGSPSAERRAKGRVACIECLQLIPCNPCEASCKFDAIVVGKDINQLPRLFEDKCTGCLSCLHPCPGQAIFIIDESVGDSRAHVYMPYEFLPLPKEGDTVTALDRTGAPLGEAKVVKARKTKRMDQTAMVILDVPRQWSMQARSFNPK